MAATPWMTSEQAARRLAVKPETLYAYVSRGLIRSERVPGQRRSRFLRVDVERHAQRSRRGGRAGGLEVVVETQLTLLDPAGRLYYRGWDVADAVERATFEEVASWLWTGEPTATPFIPDPATLEAARRMSVAATELPPIDRFRAALAAMRHADPFRADRRADAVATTGRSVIATLVDSLDLIGHDARPGARLAARLWPRLTSAPPSTSKIRTLDSLLVLLADHELAASTLAARIAASTWADPYLVLQAGFAVLGGPLHGGASEQARHLLRDVAATSAAVAIGRRLGNSERIPGFGHRVYETADPRAALLLSLLGHPDETPDAAQSVLDVMAERHLPFPNIDFAIAVMAESFSFVEGATEAIFAIARTVGWLAHAIEEYEHALRFRTRAAYVGPPPRSTPPPQR